MTRVAVVDLGTNSTRLLVAEVVDGRVAELDRRLTITRLGQGVDGSGRLLPEAIDRVEACVAGYVRAAKALGAERELAFATSAVRDAANGSAFLAGIEARLGIATRLLSGDDEARLTFRGVASGRVLDAPTAVVDLGGGSTELTVGSAGGIDFAVSLDVGCVRLTERFLYDDPPAPGQVEALELAVAALVRERVPMEIRPAIGIGVAGTVTTLAMLHLGLAEEDPALVHRHVLPLAWIADEARRLASTPVAELRGWRGIVAERAPVIAAGALALAVIVEQLGLGEVEVSEADILQGAALELAGS